MRKLQLTSIQYSFGLGILAVTWIHLPSPRALYVFVIASLLTALRFNALGWKTWKAFIPAGIAVAGTALGLMTARDAGVSKHIAHLWRGFAVISQFGMTIRAVLAWADCDPRSGRMALLQDMMAKRRALMALKKSGEPILAEQAREGAAMMALHEELRLYGQLHGFGPSPAKDAIRARMDEQLAVWDRSRQAAAAQHERMRAAIDELTAATEALKGYRRAA